jgi:acyl carrier protein
LPGPTPAADLHSTTPDGTATDGTAVDHDDLEHEVLTTIRQVLVDVIGEDYVTELVVDEATAFRADLDIESIEFVALGEALRAIYGDRIDFVEWLTTMELEEIIALTVGELVDHVVHGLRTTAPPSPPGDRPEPGAGGP